jgi:hypothetical protein
MFTPKEVGSSLSRAHNIIKERHNIHVIHTSEMPRTDRELLLKTGWLEEIIKGWYLLTRPDVRPGDSSAWYAAFWDFLYVYLSRFCKENYCLSAENSLGLHLGVTIIPKQVVVIASKGRGSPIKLPFDTSLLIYAAPTPPLSDQEKIQKLQVMSLPYALCKTSPTFFQNQPREAEIALQSISDSENLLKVILENNFIRAAGRLVGAYRFLGNEKMANKLVKGLSTVNFKIQETNPFAHEKPLISSLPIQSPYAARIIAMWHQYREDVIKHFRAPKEFPMNKSLYLEKLDEQYSQDAYHSLSIEGYQVNETLIQQAKKEKWNPETNPEDQDRHSALAARGYYEAFLEMKQSLSKIFNEGSPGEVIKSDSSKWYQKLFSPSVTAGLISPADLFGYRRHQVYIRNSRHTPLPAHALKDSMNALFHCLKEEKNAAVRAVLGHFIFVFIHPYMDGNGRIGRFLMNTMLGSGGYPWTIVHVERQKEYLDSLEKASVGGDIVPFTLFLKNESLIKDS